MEPNKVDAIYALRDAAERKATAETALEGHPSDANRAALLDAQMKLEARTQDAIEVCHECGHQHAADQPHPASASGENVIPVDFGRGTS